MYVYPLFNTRNIYYWCNLSQDNYLFIYRAANETRDDVRVEERTDIANIVRVYINFALGKTRAGWIGVNRYRSFTYTNGHGGIISDHLVWLSDI